MIDKTSIGPFAIPDKLKSRISLRIASFNSYQFLRGTSEMIDDPEAAVVKVHSDFKA